MGFGVLRSLSRQGLGRNFAKPSLPHTSPSSSLPSSPLSSYSSFNSSPLSAHMRLRRRLHSHSARRFFASTPSPEPSASESVADVKGKGAEPANPGEKKKLTKKEKRRLLAKAEKKRRKSQTPEERAAEIKAELETHIKNTAEVERYIDVMAPEVEALDRNTPTAKGFLMYSLLRRLGYVKPDTALIWKSSMTVQDYRRLWLRAHFPPGKLVLLSLPFLIAAFAPVSVISMSLVAATSMLAWRSLPTKTLPASYVCEIHTDELHRLGAAVTIRGKATTLEEVEEKNLAPVFFQAYERNILGFKRPGLVFQEKTLTNVQPKGNPTTRWETRDKYMVFNATGIPEGHPLYWMKQAQTGLSNKDVVLGEITAERWAREGRAVDPHARSSAKAL